VDPGGGAIRLCPHPVCQWDLAPNRFSDAEHVNIKHKIYSKIKKKQWKKHSNLTYKQGAKGKTETTEAFIRVHTSIKA